MKRPSFQFYPGDWLHDVALRMVSVPARGLWIEMLCIMHQSDKYGYLKVGGKVILPPNLARMVGATLEEVEGWLEELQNAGVFSFAGDNCVYSRRMVRDEEIRKNRAAGGIKGGNPNLKKVNLTPNLTVNLAPEDEEEDEEEEERDQKKVSEEIERTFDTFWGEYPGFRKTDKKQCLTKWKTRRLYLKAPEIMAGLAAWKKSHDWQKDEGRFICAPLVFINNDRWECPPAPSVGKLGAGKDTEMPIYNIHTAPTPFGYRPDRGGNQTDAPF